MRGPDDPRHTLRLLLQDALCPDGFVDPLQVARQGDDLDVRLRGNDPIVRPLAAGPAAPHSGRVSRSVLLLLLILLLGLGYGVIDSRSIRIERVVVPCSGLPPGLSGFSIIQLSDLHSSPDFKRNREAARLLEGLQANLMVITGDFRNGAGSSQTAAQGARIVARTISQRMPVYAVRGNNDYSETMALVEKEGIQILDNRAVPVADGLWIAGWNPYEDGHPPLEKLMETVPRGALAILASHSPDVILEEGFARARLILAGHTHGVQIRIPGLPSPITLTRVGWRYTRGLCQLNGSFLYINRGIGTTMIPLRVFSAPEITVLRLESVR